MKIGKYIINLSSKGIHYLELFGGYVAIGVVGLVLTLMALELFSTDELVAVEQVQAEQVEMSGYTTQQVTHIYEDGCIDLYDTETKEYKFMCEDVSFYGSN